MFTVRHASRCAPFSNSSASACSRSASACFSPSSRPKWRLRAMNMGFGNSPMEPDPVLHHVHPKNYSFVQQHPSGELGGFEIEYNGEGRVYRGRAAGSSEPRERAVPHRAAWAIRSPRPGQVPFPESFAGLTRSGRSALRRPRLRHAFLQPRDLPGSVDTGHRAVETHARVRPGVRRRRARRRRVPQAASLDRRGCRRRSRSRTMGGWSRSCVDRMSRGSRG